MTQPISLLVCALGGEGGGVLTEWIIATAYHAGYAAQSTSIPGVAQRTGATTYYIEVFPIPISLLGGKKPIFSLNPVPGALDAIVSSELLETTRQIGNGMATKERTQIITSSTRTFTTMERMQLGDGRVDSDKLLNIVQLNSQKHYVFDMNEVARTSGTVVSAVMLGAIAGSELFPFKREDFEAVIQDGSGTSAASLRGFASAFDIVNVPRQVIETQAIVNLSIDSTNSENFDNSDKPKSTLKPEFAELFPLQVQAMFALGYARMLEYQDASYARLYVDRLKRVLAAEKESDPTNSQNFATTVAMARWLALWMAFDDIVRVADLKSRSSRWQRVVAEVKAKDDDLLKVYDHFKPGVPEFAALLPLKWANKLISWDRRRTLLGKKPWALPLKVGAHSVLGMLSLRALASLKWLRARGSRYAVEQNMIDTWLLGVIQGTQRHWQLGFEIAQCGRLIKGYGSTNERGKENLLHVLEHLAKGIDPALTAEAIAAVCNAALADESGKAFDATLQDHGAPRRAVKEHPMRFVRKTSAFVSASIK